MPCSACRARSAACGSCGCSSIWFTAGTTVPSARTRRRCAGWKLDTPIARARPSAAIFSSARQVSVYASRRGMRPVDQVQVDVVQAELAERGVEGAQRRVVPLLGVPQLGGDEQLLARQARGGQRPAGALLVGVDRGGVDAAVSGLQRGGDGRGRLGVRHLPDAEAELRHPHAVVEGDGGDLAHERSILTSGGVTSAYNPCGRSAHSRTGRVRRPVPSRAGRGGAAPVAGGAARLGTADGSARGERGWPMAGAGPFRGAGGAAAGGGDPAAGPGRSGRPAVPRRDLELRPFPAVSAHDPQAQRQALADLRAWAEQGAEDAMAWYLRDKSRKRTASRLLQGLAIGFAVAGTAVPLGTAATGALRPGLGVRPARRRRGLQGRSTTSSGCPPPGCGTSPPPTRCAAS